MSSTGHAEQSLSAPENPWQETHDQLAGAPPDSLTAAELNTLADAEFWLGRPRDSIHARQLAYRRYRQANDTPGATATAWRLFHSYFDLDETAAASGWLQRARRHAQSAPDEVESQYVALADAEWALYNGRLDEALARGRDAADAGHTFGDGDLEALGFAIQGRILIQRGDVRDGLDRLDEAMVTIVSGDVSPFATGWVYCVLLYTCQELGDVRRAAEWTDLAVRWSEERGQQSWYPGLCQLHRCEVRSLRGEWTVAEREAIDAVAELAPFGDYLIAEGQYLAGEIRRRRGDYTGAEEAFRLAHQRGRDPQPGLALLRLARGEAADAASALRLALASTPAAHPMRRGRLLAAHVEAELQAGHIDAADRSAEELSQLAEASRVAYMRGMAAMAHGAVLIARGEVDAAMPALREACEIYRGLTCPYEGARARVLMGVAARRAGDEQTARMELGAALSTFEDLGALPDAERVAGLLESPSAGPDGLTMREVQVLRLIAHVRSNREVGKTLQISEHTVARHISNIFRKTDVTSRAAAAAYAFRHHLA